MTQWLKKSTAVTVMMGPFIDDTDGKTPEIALDITEQEVLLSKNGGAFALKAETTHGVHDAAHNGWYTILLDTTDTGTLGTLDIAINMAGALPCWKSFMVVTADAWDSLFGAVVIGQAGAQAAIVANNLDHLAKTATAAADMTTEVSDDTILARMLANGDTSAFDPSTDGLHAAGVDIDAILLDTGTTLETDIDAILADTNELEVDLKDGGRLDLILDAILLDTGTTLETDIDAILADTNELELDWKNGGRLDLILDAATAPTTAAIDAALSATHGAGAWGGGAGGGAITFVYTLSSSTDGALIPDAYVWVTSNADGTGILASGTTNQYGQVTFYLDAGTVYIWRQKSGWNFVNPDVEVVV
jgi:hypothetical protein